MDRSDWCLIVGQAIISLLIVGLFATCALSHENKHHWEELTKEEKDWYKTLMRPDMPTHSCCGESDQYWCDIIKVKGDKVFCQITDDRDDAQFGRLHVPLGTWIEIPPEKLKHDRGNPTGHSIVFLSSSRTVYCFVQSTGI